MQGMKDPYKDQLSAARYKAERDIARQELDRMRPACEWVEEHGGLSHIKDIYNDFRAVVERLGVEWSESELHALMDVLDRRLMPPGMEWPRDANGVPIAVGETVWANGDRYGDCRAWYVLRVVPGVPYSVEAEDADGEKRELKPRWVTHKRPAPKVLDADGVPIKKGDTVYGTVEGGPFIVTEVSDKGSVFVDAFPDTGMHGSMFTHTKPELPDSWERVEEDCSISERQYYAQRIGHDVGLKDDEEVHVAVSLDLVRRCRALAERERGE